MQENKEAAVMLVDKTFLGELNYVFMQNFTFVVYIDLRKPKSGAP